MNILLTAKFINSIGNGGGSGSFFDLLYKSFKNSGHNVVITTDVNLYKNSNFDIIITSHNKLNDIKHNPSFKIHICHGVIPKEEQPILGANSYVSISNEVYDNLKSKGFLSTIIPQPIKIPENYTKCNKILKNILVIRNAATKGNNFDILKNQYNLVYNDTNKNIFEQINAADLIISLGRGALEAMSYGKNVLIADNRFYMGNLADGLLTPDNINKISYNNFSGRCNNIKFNNNWLLQEVLKYDFNYGEYLREYVKKYHDVNKIIQQYIQLREKCQ